MKEVRKERQKAAANRNKMNQYLKKTLFIKVFGFVIILSVWAINISCGTSALQALCITTLVSKEDALETGKRKLKEHCERENLNISDFSGPQISKSKDVPWILHYASSTKPVHVFIVTIDSCGGIELSSS